LPSKDRVAGNAPRGAFEVDLALEEIEVQRAVIETPFIAFTAAERLAEYLVRTLDAQEMLLVGCLLVCVGRRDLHHVDLQLVVEEVEDRTNRLGTVLIEERRVGIDPEAASFGILNRLDRFVENAVTTDGLIVTILHTVE